MSTEKNQQESQEVSDANHMRLGLAIFTKTLSTLIEPGHGIIIETPGEIKDLIKDDLTLVFNMEDQIQVIEIGKTEIDPSKVEHGDYVSIADDTQK